MMEKRRRRAQLVCTIAVVLGLHLTIVWMLARTSRIPPMRAKSQRLEFVFIAPPAVSITVTYPGASAETVQSTVVQVIEQQLSGLDPLLYFSSESDKDGSITITLNFDQGTNPDIA